MGRRRRMRELSSLDPVAARTRIVRAMIEYEFPWDMQRSLELALFRTFAVPSIGRLLQRTGQFTESAQRRYDDTLLLLYHVWIGHPEGSAAERVAGLDQLNRIHGHYRISNHDFRYTLSTFVVVPIRWLQRYGWREPTRAEIEAWTNVMLDMAAGMGIIDVPATYEGFARLMDAYEAEHFAYDPAAAQVAAATLDLMVGWYPPVLRPLVRALVPALLDDAVVDAVGLPRSSARRRRLAESAVRARGRAMRVLPPRPDSRPYRPKVRSYPSAEPPVTELGPPALLRPNIPQQRASSAQQ